MSSATTVVAIEDVRVASTQGWVIWLKANEPTELSGEKLSVALQTGKVAVVAAGAAPEGDSETTEPTRHELISAAVAAVLDEGNPDDFTAQNKPKVSVIAAKSGVTDVKAAEIESALDV